MQLKKVGCFEATRFYVFSRSSRRLSAGYCTSLDDDKDEIFSPRNTESFPKGSASDPIDPLLSDKPCDKEKISSD